jgi:hypothetical protein
MESTHKGSIPLKQNQPFGNDCSLGKEELRPVYNKLIALFLAQIK